jgi:hypothetical protein
MIFPHPPRVEMTIGGLTGYLIPEFKKNIAPHLSGRNIN